MLRLCWELGAATGRVLTDSRPPCRLLGEDGFRPPACSQPHACCSCYFLAAATTAPQCCAATYPLDPCFASAFACLPSKQKLTDDMDDYWKAAPKKGEAKAAEEPAEAAAEAPEAAAEEEAAEPIA